ncbi:hypothetical protein [Flagellimonas iocasae]|uniref:Glycoside hydrolase 123 C-terminal domain-containing protein n=1 Tax=Flagellimonas iocasae TaxID=2055905 RepID=A0ABW4Y251_9FLAO
MNTLASFKSILLIMALSLSPILSAQIVNVWAVGDGEKVFRYNTDHFAEKNNSIWDGEKVKLRGLYNEVLGFQVIVELDSLGAKSLEISMTPPVNTVSGDIVGGDGTIAYGPQGSIDLFSQHYLNVTKPTKPAWYYGSENSAPENMVGWIPDALIPSNALGKGGFPLTVPKTREITIRMQHRLEVIERQETQNQGFWIDLYLPRDRNFASGVYTSEITVWVNGKAASKLPVEIELINAYLPDENHSNVWMFTSKNSMVNYFRDLEYDEVMEMMKFEAHRHRVDLVGGFDVHSSVFSLDAMNQYKPYLDGSAFTAENGYQGPGQGVGEKLFTVGIYGNPVLGRTKDSVQSESNKWVTWFEENSPDTRYFWYMIDEPGEVQYPYIKQNAEWVKSNPGPGKRLPIFTTTAYKEELKDVIDIFNGYRGIQDYEQFKLLKERGGDHWFYNGNRPFYGSVILEAEAVDFRVNGWIKHLFGINTWFIWHGSHWQHNFQGPKGNLQQRVFNEPLTFINWGFNYGNGDGVVFYPGRMPYHKEEDRGLNKVLPSIRLKNIRRGQQDHELLWLAEQKIGKAKVSELIRKVVPKAMHEVDKDDPVAWSQRGDDYDKIRNEILNLLK